MTAVEDRLDGPRWRTAVDEYPSALAWSPTGSLLAIATLGGDALLADPDDPDAIVTLRSHPLGTLSIAWHPSGNLVATGGQDGHLRLHRPDGTAIADHDLGAWVASLDWQPNGALLAAGAGRVLHLVDPDGAVQLSSQPLPSTVTEVAWATTKRRVAAACYGGVWWFEAEHGPRPAKHFAWKGSVLTVRPSPDGRWLPVGAQDSTVHIWRLWSADELEMNGYPTKVEHLAWHHASRWMAVGNLGEITIWDFAGKGPGGRRPRQVEAHERSISALAYQPDGDLLASGGRDGAVALWDTAGKQIAEVGRCTPTGDEVAALAWAPTGDRLAVATADGTVATYGIR